MVPAIFQLLEGPGGTYVFKRKYAQLLMKQMNSVLVQWKSQNEITEKEIYGFLHRIKGTAGTIGLTELTNISQVLLANLSEDGVKLWNREEWQYYLQPFLQQMAKENEGGFVQDGAEAVSPLDETENANQAPKNTPTNAVTDLGNSIVLIIDSNLDFASKLKEQLEASNYVALIALTMEKGMEMFYRMRPSFIVMEFPLAMAFGEKNLEQFVSVVRKSVTPIAFIGKKADRNHELKAYELGASGYFAKPLDEALFIAFLENRLIWRQDMQRITTLDELTGAFNRKYMNSIISQLIQGYRQHERPFSIAIMDLDHFKQVNDQYGHLTGDQVLKRFVAVCREHMREKDEIFRFGGEEFVISMADTDEKEAFMLIDQMRVAFQQEHFETEAAVFQATFSAGIAAASLEAETKDQLLEKADQALYQSKEQGRNQVTCYNQEARAIEARILHMIVVDDDEVVRSILKKGFQTWKEHDHIEVRVHTYADGLAFLNSNWYHPQDQYVILLDGMMPEMDGIEVLKQIRANYPDKNIVISMLSARSDEKNIILALEKGADDYLFKPFNVLEVIARMDRLAQRMLL